MKKIKINIEFTLLIILIMLNTVVIYQNYRLKKQILNSIEELELSLDDKLSKQMIMYSNIVEKQSKFLDQQINLNSKNEINEIANVRNNVYRIKNTYDSILEEQKKRTVDTSEFETSFVQNKKNAYKYYINGNYTKAYSEYENLVNFNSEDTECRIYKLKSLYYINPSDSTKYTEILNDIQILKQNNILDEECIKIEKSILSEKEGLYD